MKALEEKKLDVAMQHLTAAVQLNPKSAILIASNVHAARATSCHLLIPM
jgi:hypothetical protein